MSAEGKKGFGVTENGDICYTDDGGAHWTRIDAFRVDLAISGARIIRGRAAWSSLLQGGRDLREFLAAYNAASLGHMPIPPSAHHHANLLEAA